mgnify:CR=1 FL=1
MPDEDIDLLELTIGVGLSVAIGKTILDLEGIIAEMRLAGMNDAAIREVLFADLREGGIIFGTYRNSIKNMAKNSVEWAGAIASRGIFEDKGIDSFLWITAGGNVCAVCEVRHNEVNTMEDWRLVGLPKSGFSVCKHNCNCVLVPASYKGENLENVIIRKKK